LAFNQSFAADVNGYTALYECKAGGANCDVDVAALTTAACAQTITTADSAGTIDTKLNTGISPICLTNGDYTGKGTLTLSADGTSGARRVLRYTRSGDDDDEPWNQSGANQAQVSKLDITGDFWIVHRVTWPSNTSGGIVRSEVSGSNNIINRIVIIGPGGNNVCQGGMEVGGNSNTLQNSVVKDLRLCPDSSPVAVEFFAGNNHRIVNNEVFNWCEHAIQYGTNNIPTMLDLVIENNDLYHTSASYSGNGNMSGSAPVSMKAIGSSASPIRVFHNRIFGLRPQDGSVCGDAGTSAAMAHNAAVGADNAYTLMQNNVVTDGIIGVSYFNNTNRNSSIIGNIFYDIGPRGTDAFSETIVFQDAYATEMYLNTIILARIGTGGGIITGYNTNMDIRCNVFIDSDDIYTVSPPASAILNNNVFYETTVATFNETASNVSNDINTRANSTAYSLNDIVRTTTTPSEDGTAGDFLYKVTTAGTSAASPPAYCTTPDCQTTDGTMVVRAVRGPYSFKRKLRTVAAGEAVVIPYARVFSQAPEAVTPACPSTYADRTGIGIGDE
jgi:hypothetical protein